MSRLGEEQIRVPATRRPVVWHRRYSLLARLRTFGGLRPNGLTHWQGSQPCSCPTRCSREWHPCNVALYMLSRTLQGVPPCLCTQTAGPWCPDLASAPESSSGKVKAQWRGTHLRRCSCEQSPSVINVLKDGCSSNHVWCPVQQATNQIVRTAVLPKRMIVRKPRGVARKNIYCSGSSSIAMPRCKFVQVNSNMSLSDFGGLFAGIPVLQLLLATPASFHVCSWFCGSSSDSSLR